MRDRFMSQEYFNAYIDAEQKNISKFSDWLENNDRPEDTDRIRRLENVITGAMIKIIVARYSRGDKVSDIKPQMDEFIQRALKSEQLLLLNMDNLHKEMSKNLRN